MKAVVTGGAGFIGSHLVDLLVEEGHDVAIVDNLATGRSSNLNPRARMYEEDIDSQRFAEVLRVERPEVVFHQAAQISVKASTDDPVHDARVNVLGLLNALQACAAVGVRKFVFASSGATYGESVYLPLDEGHPQQPASPYAITKLAGEQYLRYFATSRGLAFTALRYGNVYGPRQSPQGEAGVIAIFTHQLLTGQTPMIHWDGEQVRDYIFVTDVARANLLAAATGDGRTYCIGTGVGTSVNQVFGLICEAVGVMPDPRRGPRRAGDVRAAYFDIRRARGELHWAPEVPLDIGLRHTIAAFRRELEAPRAQRVPA
jgi:UDP-glucose 4-epimerase